MIACYLRVSTNLQDADTQRRLICTSLRSREIDPDTCAWFTDDGVSGKSMDRPGWNAMMEAARGGKIKELLAYDLSRCGRTVARLLLAIEELAELGVRIVFLKDNIDTSTPMGEFALLIMAGLARIERQNTSRRTSDAVKAKIAAGHKWGRAKGSKYLTPERAAEAIQDLATMSVVDAARKHRTSRSAIYRVIGSKRRVLSPLREPVSAPAE